ncbi:MAG: peptidoglycan DD-metalloendopeptidase family protein [Clostridia bacterium]|nr:peptidoglycan DD-metalloendopeptidase family protein [Clostridia bacterium]MBQ4365656.1 peptidoglycan DD-metalloendopeptidase family protein [Clostridia bacterium]
MKKCLCVLLGVLLLLGVGTPALRLPAAHAATMAELEQEVSRIEAEIAANKQKLKDFAGKKEEEQAYLDTLQDQIDIVQKKADTLNTEIETLDNEIVGYDNRLKQLSNEISVLDDEVRIANRQIRETRTKIEDSKEALSGKLRSNYMNRRETTLKILMGADSLASFLTRLEMMRRISESEKKVINEFREEVQQLKAAKQSLEKKQGELEEKHASVEETRALAVEKKAELTKKQQDYRDTIDELDEQYKESQDYIKKLDKDSAAYQNYVKQLEAERVAADKEIDDLIRSLTATTAPPTTTGSAPYSIGNGDPSDLTTTTEQPTVPPGYIQTEIWAWPLGNYPCYISSPFGYRDWRIGGNAFHGGTDIAGSGIYGQPVFASRSGYVAAAVWGTTGYGRYVLLDHCDGFVTIYGHCSNLTVTQGQYVVQGQQIGNVGSTGNSTGPHLHFEVRYNGVKQNPMNFVQKP